MAGTILIGFGNPYRRDDGVAYHIINGVRQNFGLRPLAREDDGEDDLGGPVDTLMMHQLLPELAPMLGRYEKVIFVDAHAGSIPDRVRVVPVEEEYGFQAVTHHMSPGMLLRLVREVTGSAPQGQLVSVLGYDFDFGDDLSDACQDNAAEAVRRILEFLA